MPKKRICKPRFKNYKGSISLAYLRGELVHSQRVSGVDIITPQYVRTNLIKLGYKLPWKNAFYNYLKSVSKLDYIDNIPKRKFNELPWYMIMRILDGNEVENLFNLER